MYTAKDVTELREKTGVGMLKCKEALEATDGNMEKAIDYLREKGIAAAAKKEGRIAAEGVVESYIHAGGKIGVLIEVNCETDFVAKSDDFKTLVHDIAMHIAASNPLYVSDAEVDNVALEKEREIYRAQALNEGKPEAVVDKMVEGRVKKYLKEVCLLDQPFVKDPSKDVRTLVNEAISKIGEKITVRRFVRWVMGEGLEKRSENFAEEIQKQISAN
ncbi:MAG: translation elongation factor Ts [Clostridia bacterium]|nr:translation elongation factor Ts [Clostridia bacterium]